MSVDAPQVPLSTLAEVNPRRAAAALAPRDLVSFIAMPDVSEAGAWTRRQVRPLREVASGFTSFIEGDVLFAKITPCMENGKGAHASGLVNGIGFGSTEFHVLRAGPSADSRFVFHWSQSPRLRKRAEAFMIGSAGQQRVRPEFFDHFCVPRLAVGAQRRIAAILDTVDEAIRKTEEVIAKLQQMKQGLLHDLLTRGIDENGELRDPERHPEQFKDSPLGRIPRGWEVRPLGSVAEVLNGTTPSRERRDYWQDGTVGWLSSTRVNDYRVTAPSEWISAKALAECSLRVLPVGTVVVGMIGQGRTRGMAARLEIEATINQNLAAVVPGPYLHPLFLHIYLHSRYEALRSGGRGSNQDALNCSLVSAFPAPVPGFVEQERVATAFGELEARMIKEWESVRKLRLLKQGLMDDLLTGRIRVPVPEEPDP